MFFATLLKKFFMETVIIYIAYFVVMFFTIAFTISAVTAITELCRDELFSPEFKYSLILKWNKTKQFYREEKQYYRWLFFTGKKYVQLIKINIRYVLIVTVLWHLF